MVITLTTDDSYPIETLPHPRLHSQDQDRCAGSIFVHLDVARIFAKSTPKVKLQSRAPRKLDAAFAD
jgi:hypothetical protein